MLVMVTRYSHLNAPGAAGFGRRTLPWKSQTNSLELVGPGNANWYAFAQSPSGLKTVVLAVQALKLVFGRRLPMKIRAIVAFPLSSLPHLHCFITADGDECRSMRYNLQRPLNKASTTLALITTSETPPWRTVRQSRSPSSSLQHPYAPSAWNR